MFNAKIRSESRPWLAGAALGIASAFFAAPALAAVGAIAGNFSVTPTGQAVYTMPLPAPGGAGGLAPQLSLVYASGSGPGLLGQDATVGGISVINRCPAAYPYDSSGAPVTLTADDKFCLDGRELTVYPERFSFKSYLATPSAHVAVVPQPDDASDPEWFEAQHPDGSVWEYGHQFDSLVTATDAAGNTVNRLWALDQIEDASGNLVTFHYSQPSGTGAYYLTEVDWGGNANAGTSADHSFVFSYDTVGTDAAVYRYIAGNEIVWNRRLAKITETYNGATVWTWTPGYLSDGQGSNRSRLASVTECAGSDCLPATTFQWQQGTPGYGTVQDTGEAGPADSNDFVADVNGDGREDLIYARGNVWRVRFGAVAGGFGAEYSTGAAVTNADYAQPIHYQPGAADQILLAKNYSGSHRWAIVAWTGSGFSVTDTGVDAAATGIAATDVNGDGYDDLVTAGDHTLYVRLHTLSDSGVPDFGPEQTAYTSPNPGTDTFIGFRGVGAAAARGPRRALRLERSGAGVILRIHHYAVVCLQDGCPPGSPQHVIENWRDEAFVWSEDNLVAYAGVGFAASRTDAGGGAVVPLDVNGDGLTDLVVSGSADLELNTGSGFEIVDYGSSTAGLNLDAAVAADYGGDGRDDLLVPDTNGEWMRLASTGTGLAAPVDTGVSAANFGANPIVADTEGRMMDDLIGVNGAGVIELALRNGPYPDLLNRITDGLGNYHALDWAPLSNGDVVEATGAIDQGYELERRGPYLLVSTEQNDGVGGSYTVSYAYDTPLILAGGGFAGIEKVTASDSRSGYVTTDISAINHFVSGVKNTIVLAQANGKLIRKTTYQYSADQVVEQGDPLMTTRIATTDYDGAGNALDTVARHNGYDANYVLASASVSASSGGSTWSSATALTTTSVMNRWQWCVGLPSEVDVTRSLPDGTSLTRKTSFTPDLTACRESATKTNTQDSQTETDTTLDYGAFGNLKTATVTGHKADGSAMAARVTSYGYDSRGEYQTSLTDALGEVTGYGWNRALGLKTSETAPNGTTTSYAFNGFGQPTQTTFPSGAYQTGTWQSCSGSECDDWAYAVDIALYDSGGTWAGTRELKYDHFNRLVASGRRLERIAFNKGWSWSEREYDARGRVAEISAPHYDDDPAHWTTYSYADPLGRVTAIEAPAAGSATATTTYAYDGLATTVTDPAGNATTTTFNPLGQTASVVDAAGHTGSYGYTPFGEVAYVGGPQGFTGIDYDSAGHRSGLSAPDLGMVSFQSDSLGEVTRKTDAAGNVTNYGYDTLGRMTEESFVGASGENAHWYYATSGNGAGQLYRATKANGFTRTLGYDTLGEATTDTETYAGTAWTMHYGYDSLGRIASLTYPGTAAAQALKLTYAYDAYGDLASVKNADTGTVYWKLDTAVATPAVNAWGEVRAGTLGNGVDVQHDYDLGTGALANITAGPNHSANLVSLSYGYDAVGNTHTTFDVLTDVGRTLSYDNLSRLHQNVIHNASGDHAYWTDYEPDGSGNIASRTGVGTYDYKGAQPHAVTQITEGHTSTGYAYNALGEMSSGGDLSNIQWTAAGRAQQIAGAETTNLAYDTDGNLLEKTVAGTASRYFGQLFVKVGEGWRERIVANGEVIAVVNVTSTGYVTTDYLIHDAQGSPAALLNASGSLLARFAFNAWGELVNPATGTGSDPDAAAKEALTTIGYTGHEEFWKSGLVQTYARLYNPHLGRWLSPDPTVPNLYNGQSLNRYSYVLNNPVTYWDPYGYFSWRQFGLGLLQVGSGVAGIAEGLATAAGGVFIGVTFSETIVAIPVGTALAAYGLGSAGGSLQDVLAGFENLNNALTDGPLVTDEDAAAQMGIPPDVAKDLRSLSLVHDLSEHFVRTMLAQGVERNLQQNVHGVGGGGLGGGLQGNGGMTLGDLLMAGATVSEATRIPVTVTNVYRFGITVCAGDTCSTGHYVDVTTSDGKTQRYEVKCDSKGHCVLVPVKSG